MAAPRLRQKKHCDLNQSELKGLAIKTRLSENQKAWKTLKPEVRTFKGPVHPNHNLKPTFSELPRQIIQKYCFF